MRAISASARKNDANDLGAEVGRSRLEERVGRRAEMIDLWSIAQHKTASSGNEHMPSGRCNVEAPGSYHVSVIRITHGRRSVSLNECIE